MLGIGSRFTLDRISLDCISTASCKAGTSPPLGLQRQASSRIASFAPLILSGHLPLRLDARTAVAPNGAGRTTHARYTRWRRCAWQAGSKQLWMDFRKSAVPLELAGLGICPWMPSHTLTVPASTTRESHEGGRASPSNSLRRYGAAERMAQDPLYLCDYCRVIPGCRAVLSIEIN